MLQIFKHHHPSPGAHPINDRKQCRRFFSMGSESLLDRPEDSRSSGGTEIGLLCVAPAARYCSQPRRHWLRACQSAHTVGQDDYRGWHCFH